MFVAEISTLENAAEPDVTVRLSDPIHLHPREETTSFEGADYCSQKKNRCV